MGVGQSVKSREDGAQFRCCIRHPHPAYDVVLLQEDFVYHALLAREASHAIIRRSNGARSKLFGMTSPVMWHVWFRADLPGWFFPQRVAGP